MDTSIRIVNTIEETILRVHSFDLYGNIFEEPILYGSFGRSYDLRSIAHWEM